MGRSGRAAAAFGNADVCVVGSGPVGLTLAKALGSHGLRIVLLESGDIRPDAKNHRPPDADFLDPVRHAPMSLAVCRALGGTSWLWGGRCVPLDPIDFEGRSSSGDDTWPIWEQDVAQYYEAAAEALGCGEARFSIEQLDEHPAACGLRLDRLERWCNEPRTSVRSLPDTLQIVLNATVTGLRLREGEGSVAAVRVVTGGEVKEVSARIFVFACGGVETARLMLNIQREYPNIFGGDSGPLGRYYMGHLSGCIANIAFSAPQFAKIFQYQSANASVFRRRITLTEGAMRSCGLPNIAFYPDNPRFADAAHGRGILSLIFLLFNMPWIGKRLISEAIRQMQLSEDPHFADHIKNVVRDVPSTVAMLFDICWQRFVRFRRKPSLFLLSRSSEYPLHYHAEHTGSSESRVRLSEKSDDIGLLRLNIDLRFTREDADGVERAHNALDSALRKSGIGQLHFYESAERRAASILNQARDGFHQIGLARMGRREGDGVVDGDCKVFGLQNLYVAGSSVFRSSGQANPTFTSVALALRLADHIRIRLRTSEGKL